jgi:hypothetical protein
MAGVKPNRKRREVVEFNGDLFFHAEKVHSVRFDSRDEDPIVRAVYINKKLVPKPYHDQRVSLVVQFR